MGSSGSKKKSEQDDGFKHYWQVPNTLYTTSRVLVSLTFDGEKAVSTDFDFGKYVEPRQRAYQWAAWTEHGDIHIELLDHNIVSNDGWRVDGFGSEGVCLRSMSRFLERLARNERSLKKIEWYNVTDASAASWYMESIQRIMDRPRMTDARFAQLARIVAAGCFRMVRELRHPKAPKLEEWSAEPGR